MTLTLDNTKDQRLIHSGMDWQQFKLIEQGFSDSPGIRLFYFKGEGEILAISQEHEIFSSVGKCDRHSDRDLSKPIQKQQHTR